MTELSLAQAAQAVGMNRSSILRALKSGKISGARDHNGSWRVQPAELFRVFEPVASAAARPAAMPQDAQGDSTDALVAELRAVIADLRQERDKWQAAHEREQAAHAATQRMLLPAPAPAEKRRTWWWAPLTRADRQPGRANGT